MDINVVAMEVIINAGDGREYINQAMEKMAECDFAEAQSLLERAQEKITKAHNAQTEVIQSQAAGENVEYSLLFIHAQDTIMTIDTQLRITKGMLPVFKNLYEKKEKE